MNFVFSLVFREAAMLFSSSIWGPSPITTSSIAWNLFFNKAVVLIKRSTLYHILKQARISVDTFLELVWKIKSSNFKLSGMQAYWFPALNYKLFLWRRFQQIFYLKYNLSDLCASVYICVLWRFLTSRPSGLPAL